MKDYYKILGIERTATEADIKKAYRKLAKQYHPDSSTGDEAKFKEISEAYETLNDKDKRQKYDNPNQGFDFSGFGLNDFDFGFGFNPFARQKPTRGKDAQREVIITLEEAAKGVSKEVNFHQIDSCKSCKGVGGKSINCPACNGVGRRQFKRGMQTVITHCETCNGNGYRITEPCEKCGGVGRTQNNKTVSIKIPPGVRDGEPILVKGEGHLDNISLPRGDLRCFIRVMKHKNFVRSDNNLISKISVNAIDACLGVSVELETIYGETVSLKVPAGIQHGQTLKIAGKGMPGRGSPHFASSGKGDMLIFVEISIPKNINDKAKKLLKQLKKEL